MSASGRNNFPCPINKKENFEDCKHSWADIEQHKKDEHTRKIVREEFKRLQRAQQ